MTASSSELGEVAAVTKKKQEGSNLWAVRGELERLGRGKPGWDMRRW
jgi:hypothetical protein